MAPARTAYIATQLYKWIAVPKDKTGTWPWTCFSILPLSHIWMLTRNSLVCPANNIFVARVIGEEVRQVRPQVMHQTGCGVAGKVYEKGKYWNWGIILPDSWVEPRIFVISGMPDQLSRWLPSARCQVPSRNFQPEYFFEYFFTLIEVASASALLLLFSIPVMFSWQNMKQCRGTSFRLTISKGPSSKGAQTSS